MTSQADPPPAASEPVVSPSSLEGRVAIVTGGGAGIGRACCGALIEAGAFVVVVDVDVADDAIRSLPAHRLLVLPFDVSKPALVADAFQTIMAAQGRVDILINNAGTSRAEPLLESRIETWRHTFAVNVEGAFLMAQQAALIMRDQEPLPGAAGRGTIINVSSPAAETGRPLLASYGASKAALNHLTKSFAVALDDSEIATCAVYPGTVASGMWSQLADDMAVVEGVGAEQIVEQRIDASPTGRLQTPDEVATSIVWLASRPGSEINGRLLWTTSHMSQL